MIAAAENPDQVGHHQADETDYADGRLGPAPTGLVTIESDRQRADNRTGIVTATGNVRITYPDRGMVATSRQAFQSLSFS